MFTFNIVAENNFITVLPDGELAYDVCNEFKDIVSGRMGPGICVSFNMEKVSFLDCAGVGFLLQMKKLAEKRQGSFEMRRLQRNVKMVMDKLTLNEVLNVSKEDLFPPDGS